MHTGEPFIPEPSAFGVEIAIGKLKRYKSPVIYQIPTELVQTGGSTLRSVIQKLINSVWKRKNCHSSGRNLFIVPIYKKG
jgi:hypothetical protein